MDGLSDDQKQNFADYLWSRRDSIVNQLMGDFWARRKIYEMQMNNDFTWRRNGGTRDQVLEMGIEGLCNQIFDINNDSVNIVGGFAAFMTARSIDDIKGTKPYYSIYPEGVEDNVLAETMQRHSEWKLRRSGLSAALDDAIDLAYGLGEGVIKVRYERLVDIYEEPATVLFHEGLGQPVQTNLGDYVYQGDQVSTQDAQAMNDDGTPALDGLTGQPLTQQVLTTGKDPSIQIPMEQATWKEMYVERERVRYAGVRAEMVHYKDFLVPLTAASLEEADFRGHQFQMRLSEAKTKFSLDALTIAEFESVDMRNKTEEAKPNFERGETEENRSWTTEAENDPMILFCECWVDYNPFGDEKGNRRIAAVLAVDQKIIVAMDYMANLTPDGDLPFFVVRAYRAKNRWYGIGFYEAYENEQTFIDRQLNRIEYRNQFHTNPPIFFDPTLLEESEETQADFALEPGRQYRKKGGVKTEDVWTSVTLPDLDERTWQLKQFMIQIIQVRSGVTSAAQGEVSSLPSTSTATGIESIMQSASTLARQPIGNLKEEIQPAVWMACRLIYANLDVDETYSYFNGETQKVGVLQMASVQGLSLNVNLLMTRFRQREQVENAQKGMETLGWYLSIPEPEKPCARILAVQAVNGLGFNNAEQIIRQPLQLQPDAMGQPTIDPRTGQPFQAMQPKPAQQPKKHPAQQ